jgi:hypothetical protein
LRIPINAGILGLGHLLCLANVQLGPWAMTISPTNPDMIRTPRSLKRARGRPFVKGKAKTAGRKAGVPNVTSRAIKEMITACADGLGGLARLMDWCKESEKNEYAFWTIVYPRIMPIQISGTGKHGEIELNVKFSREQVQAELAKRHLPLSIFGYDAPVLNVATKQIEHVPAVTNGDRDAG